MLRLVEAEVQQFGGWGKVECVKVLGGNADPEIERAIAEADASRA